MQHHHAGTTMIPEYQEGMSSNHIRLEQHQVLQQLVIPKSSACQRQTIRLVSTCHQIPFSIVISLATFSHHTCHQVHLLLLAASA
eukprot:4259838-Amphidinium_carterae.1